MEQNGAATSHTDLLTANNHFHHSSTTASKHLPTQIYLFPRKQQYFDDDSNVQTIVESKINSKNLLLTLRLSAAWPIGALSAGLWHN